MGYLRPVLKDRCMVYCVWAVMMTEVKMQWRENAGSFLVLPSAVIETMNAYKTIGSHTRQEGL